MQVHKNYPLKKLNTFGIAAAARWFAAFENEVQLRELADIYSNHHKLILGGGSNILFTKDFDGLVLHNSIRGVEKVNENNETVLIRAGGGEIWHELVMYCVEHGYGGIENLALIPGSVGASPMQNIGAYGVEIKDAFESLQAYDMTTNNVVTFSIDDCEFGYRESVFKKKYKNRFVILYVTLRLQKSPVINISYKALQQQLDKENVSECSLKTIAHAVISIRSSKLPNPALIGSAGSFFKNPIVSTEFYEALKATHKLDVPHFPQGDSYVKLPAGWLIEQCGWRGYRKGDAGCYDKQALVIVNYGNATGNEVFELSEKIRISVKEKFGVELVREVNVI